MMQTLIIVLLVLLVAFCGVMVAIFRIEGEMDDVGDHNNSNSTDGSDTGDSDR